MVALLAFGAYSLWKQGMLPANEAAEGWVEARSTLELLVSLPKDDAPHKNYMEWWYYNGYLEADSGDRYSFHYALFVINAMTTHTVAHVSFVDQRTGKHLTDQKRSAGNPSSGIRNGFNFVLGEWTMAGGDGKDQLRVATPRFSFNLQLAQTAPPVFQGGTGYLDFGPAGGSYYYSRPRLAITGSVKLGDRIQPVKGLAWFDHQWGDFRINTLGWDWFAIQLDDGADVMLYQLFDTAHLPALRSGTYTKDGNTQVLGDTDFMVGITDHWVSPETGTDYPAGWVVTLPDQGIELKIDPVVTASEFDGRLTSYKVYWEGAVKVSGTHSGRGFVEMSGYQDFNHSER